jgi:hypothetical protein
MINIQTKYGAMILFESMEELEGFTYQDCVNWLQFNDSNGCYSIEDQTEEFGDIASIDDMKEMILKQSANA